jgi:phosphonatase-like hydrolase
MTDGSAIRLVVFDVAGTIIEDRGEVVSAFVQALKLNQIEFQEEEIKEWKGAAKRDVFVRLVERQWGPQAPQNSQRIEAAFGDFRRILEESYQKDVKPVPGALETFQWLRARHCAMATTTGFYRQVHDLILRSLGWENMFDASVTSDEVSQGRPAPFMIFRAMERTGVTNVKQVVNAGDTPLDLQAGTNAGVIGVVAVLTGIHGAERLRKEQYTHIIPSVAELPELLTKHF